MVSVIDERLGFGMYFLANLVLITSEYCHIDPHNPFGPPIFSTIKEEYLAFDLMRMTPSASAAVWYCQPGDWEHLKEELPEMEHSIN